MANIEVKEFSQINLNDPFFESLKKDYAEFESWYNKKSLHGEKAYVLYGDMGLTAFLYLKIEDEAIVDIMPVLPAKRRLKIGTFKIDAHGTKLGERFIKKIIDNATENEIDEIYVTAFVKHSGLITLLNTFGFDSFGTKNTTNGEEQVYIKRIGKIRNSILKDYPIMQADNINKHVLSIYPKFHSQLFPDSILNNETYDLLQDISHTNSIHKIYICGMEGVTNFQNGDLVLIYRTSDGQGAAYYRSVITSLCVIEEVKNIAEFRDIEEYLTYCKPYSIFSDLELKSFYLTKKYPYIIKMTYNAAFKRRVTNGCLVSELGITPSYWGVFRVSDDEFTRIIREGGVNESLIIY
jgi:hypothetical protein